MGCYIRRNEYKSAKVPVNRVICFDWEKQRVNRLIYPETPDKNSTPREVSVRKGGIFRPGKEIEGLRGGVRRYAAQGNPKIDTARAEKDPFRTETNLPAELIE